MNINEYENFCKTSEYGNFMQSSNWANVKTNWLSEYITVRNQSGTIIGGSLVLVRKIPLLNTAMLYAPRGFVCDMHDKEILQGIFFQIKQIAKKHHAFVLKLDPMIDENDNLAIENLTNLGFKYHGEKVGYDNIQCRENYLLDLNNRSIDEIFSSFKSKWRYNIRLAQRKGVECSFYGKEKLDDFIKLMEQTGKRDGFDIRSKEYFSRVLDAFDGKAKLCMCYLDNIPLSGALFINYGGTTSYVYGCSSNEHRNFMPNYLMQWNMIKHAKETGCTKYDFCGIPYWYDENHHNYGVYKFKQGFNGYVKTYAGEFDYTFRANLQRCAKFLMYLKKKI